MATKRLFERGQNSQPNWFFPLNSPSAILCLIERALFYKAILINSSRSLVLCIVVKNRLVIQFCVPIIQYSLFSYWYSSYQQFLAEYFSNDKQKCNFRSFRGSKLSPSNFSHKSFSKIVLVTTSTSLYCYILKNPLMQKSDFKVTSSFHSSCVIAI